MTTQPNDFLARRSLVASAVFAALALNAHGVSAQSFDPGIPAVIEGYSTPLTNAKVEAARAGLNQLLPEVARFPGLVPNVSNGSGFGSGGFTTIGGGLPSVAICPRFCSISFFITEYTAGSDGDLNVLGNPATLSAAILRATASFTTARDFVIGPNPATINTAGFELAISGTLTANAQLHKSGTGTLTLSGNNVWLVAPVVGEGTLRGSTTSLNSPIQNSGIVEFNQASEGVYAHVVSGTGGLTKSGAGTLTITADNTYTGPTRIEAGRVALQAAGQLGRGASLFVGSDASLDLTLLPSSMQRDIGAMSGSGSVLLGSSALQTTSASDSTFAGVISGGGSLRKSGSGRLTLTNANTYTGGATIFQGALALAAAGRLHANGALSMAAGTTFDLSAADGSRSVGSIEGDGAIVLGSNAFSIGSNDRDTTFAGTIVGTGNVTKVGLGTLTLTGTTQHAGTTMISQGTLRARAQSLGSSIVNDATLALVEQRTEPNPNALPVPAGSLHTFYPEFYTYTGNISGSGRLVKQGNGAIWLRGENSYSGGTLIDDGVLIGNDRSLQGNITNNAGLAFYQGVSGTYFGTTSGSGILLKYGPGNLTLSGLNTHTGGTAFSGPLTISDDRNLGAAGANVVIAGGMLRTTSNITTGRSFGLGAGGATFDTSGNTFAITGTVIGPGTLTKVGTGTLNLTGPNSYTGGTVIVSAGTFSFRNNLASGVMVASSATLSGAGTIAGSLDLVGGSTLRVFADANGNADRIVVTNANVQGAAVDVQAQSGNYGFRTRYNILSAANGIVGRFDRVSANLAFLRPALEYDARNVYLDLLRNDLTYQAVAANPVQAGIAGALNNLSLLPSADAQAVTLALDSLSAEGARAAFDSVGGIGRAAVTQVQQMAQHALTQQVAGRLAFADAGGSGSGAITMDSVRLAFEDSVRSDARPVYHAALASAGIEAADSAKRHGFWLRGYGGGGRIDGSVGASGASFDFSGLIIGYDQAIDERLRAGALVSYSKPKLAQSAPANSVEVETRQIGIYGRYRNGPVRVDGLASIAWSDSDSSRGVFVGGLARTALGSFGGRTTSLYAEAGYTLHGAIEIEPIAALQWSRQRDDPYTESGAGVLNLSVAGREAESARSTLGLRAARRFDFGGTHVTLEGRAAWAHEYRGQGSISARLAADTTGASFMAPGTELPRNNAILGVGVSVQNKRALSLYADLSADANRAQHTYALGVGLRYRW